MTLGTVLVSLVYEFVLRQSHEKQLLDVVTTGLLGRASECGLAQVEKVDFTYMFGRLKGGDELWWLDTYCPDMSRESVQTAIRNALQLGASLRLLVIDPDCSAAKARAEEIRGDGYAPDTFQEGARTNLRILERIKGTLPSTQAERLQITTYSDLPGAPMYLRLRDGQPIDGWTSYFLARPTYEVAHFNWGRPERSSKTDSLAPGLGLDAFRAYFDDKWTRALAQGPGPGVRSDNLLDDARSVLESLNQKRYELVTALLDEDLDRVIKSGANVLTDGKLRRTQDAATRALLLDLATGREILLVHSPSENRIFETGGPVFWQHFNRQLQERVAARELAGVRRLFVVEDMTELNGDEVLLRQLAYHTNTQGYDSRVLSREMYDEVQEEHSITATPIHDFGLYGDIAYIWQRPGYSQAGAVRGYFQLDGETVDRYKAVFEQCWTDGTDVQVDLALGESS